MRIVIEKDIKGISKKMSQTIHTRTSIAFDNSAIKKGVIEKQFFLSVDDFIFQS